MEYFIILATSWVLVCATIYWVVRVKRKD